MTTIVAGQTAPDFSLKSIDGTEYSLKKLLERGPVLVSFFKVSCPVCQFTFPFLERLYKRYGSEEITFLGISQDNPKASKEFADEVRRDIPRFIGRGRLSRFQRLRFDQCAHQFSD